MPRNPDRRPRRLRRTPALRRFFREQFLTPSHFIYPIFVTHGKRGPIPSMPGVARQSVEGSVRIAEQASSSGINAIILFGLASQKDELGREAMDITSAVPQAIEAIKAAVPNLVIITDVCLCSYTTHGHCGVLKGHTIDNDATLPLIAEMACVHAQAGADMVAPSGMMDHQVGAIRQGLDRHNYSEVSILSYSVKYASAFYGPFRDAADGAPQFGDRKSYQMDPPNGREALREVRQDLNEGADMVMVKPALAYLDIVNKIRTSVPEAPLAAYNVSGEYSMLKAAAEKGWVDERAAALEMLMAILRAGADRIITYYALEAAAWLQE